MSQTNTTHEPGPDELAHAVADPAAANRHGAHDIHADAGETLGPVDVMAWGALLLGAAAGLLVVACLVLTVSLSAPVSA